MIARRTPLKRRKRIIVKRSTLKNKADRLFSLLIRSVGHCQKCGATDGLQCSHFLSRRYSAVRWNPLNAECLCYRCHKFFTERPVEAAMWAEHRLGAEPLAELRRLALARSDPPDYRLIVDELNARIAALR